MRHMVDDITVGKKHNRSVRGEEDKNVPDSMQVREANAGPIGTEESKVRDLGFSCFLV